MSPTIINLNWMQEASTGSVTGKSSGERISRLTKYHIWVKHVCFFLFLLFNKYCMGRRNVKAKLSNTDVEHMHLCQLKGDYRHWKHCCGLAVKTVHFH